MAFIKTRDGVNLYLKEWGSGHSVVMMHGWPLSSDTFDDLSMAIANAGMRAIAYDRRGFGRSDQPWRGYDYDTFADDLADVITATNAEEATLVGFSMGGGEVARYLSRYSDNSVRDAILIASIVPFMLKTPDNPPGVEQSVFDQMSLALREDRAAFWPGFFKHFYGVGAISHPVSDQVIAWSCNLAMQASLYATLTAAHAFATTDFRSDLASIEVPTLIIHGTSDQTVPIETSAREAAKGIRESILREYEGAPHGLFASHKTTLITDVLQFLNGASDVGRTGQESGPPIEMPASM
jgi:non-heme chloroperoxidase